MSIKIVWDNDEKTVVRYIFDKQWTWPEFFTAKAEAYALIGSVKHPVGIIMDAPPEVKLPPNTLTHSRNALRNKHPNTRVIAFVLTHSFVRSMIHIFMKVAPGSTDLHIVSTLEEARQVVAERLDSIENSKP
jgi:hypothetical protein